MRRASISPRSCQHAADGNYTDIAAALKLALASFPDDTGKRIVLISDGNENLGNAEEQAPPRQARSACRSTCCRWPPDRATRTKCWSSASRRRRSPSRGAGARSACSSAVTTPTSSSAGLTLKQIIEGQKVPWSASRRTCRLRRGLNSFTFKRPLTDEQRSYTYEAEFLPERVEDDNGKVLKRPAARRPRAEQPRRHARRGARPAAHSHPRRARPATTASWSRSSREAGTGKFKVVAEPVAVLDATRTATSWPCS